VTGRQRLVNDRGFDRCARPAVRVPLAMLLSVRRRVAERRPSEQRLAEQRLAEQRLAEQRWPSA
jgi:hypothetical protein